MNYVEKWLYHRGYSNENRDLTGFVDVSTAGVIKEFCEAHNFNLKTLEEEFARKEFEEYENKKFGVKK